jgi:hypothetical protein
LILSRQDEVAANSGQNADKVPTNDREDMADSVHNSKFSRVRIDKPECILTNNKLKSNITLAAGQKLFPVMAIWM